MNQLILEDGSVQRRHRQRLSDLLASTRGTLRIATAYVTDRELLAGDLGRERRTRLLISLSKMDVASGATSIETLRWLLQSGVDCRVLPDRPRLHAKVYIMGTSRAVVTSANLTGSAFDSNIEVGVEVKPTHAKQLAAWFDRLWAMASPLTVRRLVALQEATASLRGEFARLTREAKANAGVRHGDASRVVLTDSLRNLFRSARRFFVCNTDRRQGERTETGGYQLEEEMLSRGYATAWEEFKFPTHMQQVEAGDAVFMFAKAVGIIGVGVASGRCETVLPGDPDRVDRWPLEGDSTEWRVPVRWLAWTDDAGAYRCRGPNSTFWSITEPKHRPLREGAKSHFLSRQDG